jgi:hypothetical protein
LAGKAVGVGSKWIITKLSPIYLPEIYTVTEKTNEAPKKLTAKDPHAVGRAKAKRQPT